MCTAAALLALLSAEPDLGAPLLLTSGWHAVLDVPDLRAVVIEDSKVASFSDLHDGTVTLAGLTILGTIARDRFTGGTPRRAPRGARMAGRAPQ